MIEKTETVFAGDMFNALSVLFNYPELLEPHRDAFIELLDQTHGQDRDFVLQALTAIDGQMRDDSSEDWYTDIVAVADSEKVKLIAHKRFHFDAEWAQHTRPNFQIDTEEGRRCLTLREGAGGRSFWRKTSEYTVEIGEFDSRFNIAESGRYQFWFYCWFSGKCGNHSSD